MNEAVLFPGQGAQFPGMGRDWVTAFPSAARLFERAERALGFSLRAACWDEGERVHRTDIAQPGILTTSAAIVAVLEERGLERTRSALTAGLSLGEYTALWYAGVLEFEDAVRLVRLRGEAMQAASERTPSSMTSLMGATSEQAEALAAVGRTQGICALANLNAPGQIVLSGELAALDAAEAAAPQHGVKRAVRLSVAGGFHSECMRSASEQLERALAEVTLRAPRIPFVSNVTASPLRDPDEIKQALARQVCAPVLWERSMRYTLDSGIDAVLEPGPGNVLCGLMRRIAKDAGGQVVSLRGVERPDDLEVPA
ncbi:MAG: ACP S-malonyltransferase [Planctomycetes bacterium]|nr:ACP S-malonyltransferase [Planctomycetota bacterium]